MICDNQKTLLWFPIHRIERVPPGAPAFVTVTLPSSEGTTTVESNTNFAAAAPSRRDRHRPYLARSSRQENLDLAGAGRNRGRQARRADGADPDEPARRMP
jgi:hypothetical protein